jgi:uncharacterized protein (TIGR03067 family)
MKESAMKTAVWLGAATLLLASFPVGAADKDKDKEDKFDAAKLVGTWKYVSGEKNGDKVDADKLKDDRLVITKETLTLKGEQTFVLKYTLDAKKSPVALSMVITEGPFGKDEKTEGIIELSGDDLKFCYALPGEKAPTKFEAKDGSKAHFFVLKRSK